MFDQQHQRNNTVLFCGLESENSCATDFIADDGRDIASDITTEIFFKELFSDLTEKEKKIVSDYFIMGKQVKETAAELGISTRQVSRDKNSALAKMLRIIADNICGGDSRYLGSQGSSVIKVFDITAATTGINETNAKKSGLEVDTVILCCAVPDRFDWCSISFY